MDLNAATLFIFLNLPSKKGCWDPRLEAEKNKRPLSFSRD